MTRGAGTAEGPGDVRRGGSAPCNVAPSKAPSHCPGDLPPAMRGIWWDSGATEDWSSPWGSGSISKKKK